MERKIIISALIIMLAAFLFFVLTAKPKNITDTKNNNELISEKDITPANMNGVRPDVVRIGDIFYVNFLETAPKRSLGIIMVGSNLVTEYLGEIYSGPPGSSPTDARMIADDTNNLWYPFEAVYFNPDKNYLNLARYDITGQVPRLIDSKDKIALGDFANPSMNKFPKSGTEQVDDPLPFYYSDKYYVMTRTFQTPTYIVRVFGSNLELIDEYSLDLSSAVGQYALSVNSLLAIENETYMITGIFNNLPPGDNSAIAKIVAIPLRDDLRTINGKMIELTDGKKYAGYVSSAKYKDGKLYVLHNNFIGKNDDTIHEGVLEIYDVQNNFSLIKTIGINSGKMIDNHMTMEFLGDKLYVFYNTPKEKIMVKIISI